MTHMSLLDLFMSAGLFDESWCHLSLYIVEGRRFEYLMQFFGLISANRDWPYVLSARASHENNSHDNNNNDVYW